MPNWVRRREPSILVAGWPAGLMRRVIPSSSLTMRMVKLYVRKDRSVIHRTPSGMLVRLTRNPPNRRKKKRKNIATKFPTAIDGARLLIRKHMLVAVMERTTSVNRKMRNFSA